MEEELIALSQGNITEKIILSLYILQPSGKVWWLVSTLKSLFLELHLPLNFNLSTLIFKKVISAYILKYNSHQLFLLCIQYLLHMLIVLDSLCVWHRARFLWETVFLVGSWDIWSWGCEEGPVVIIGRWSWSVTSWNEDQRLAILLNRTFPFWYGGKQIDSSLPKNQALISKSTTIIYCYKYKMTSQ